jgi:hypothetical protein
MYYKWGRVFYPLQVYLNNPSFYRELLKTLEDKAFENIKTVFINNGGSQDF